MANPNIIDVTTILGKSAAVSLTTTAATAVVSNAAASGKVFKINSLVVSNVDGTNAADITVSYYSEDDIGGTGLRSSARSASPQMQHLWSSTRAPRSTLRKTVRLAQQQALQMISKCWSPTKRSANRSL